MLGASTFPAARYQLEFVTEQPIQLPDYAGSALRGAFGHALRRAACVTGAPECTNCPLLRSCAYPAIFEGPPPLQPARRKLTSLPLPFVVEPPRWGECQYRQGDPLRFSVVLIGPALAHLPLVLMAWRQALLGGLGPQCGTARLHRVHLEGDDNPLWTSDGASAPALRPRAHTAEVTLPVTPAAGSSLAPPAQEAVTLLFETPLRLQSNGRVIGIGELTPSDLLMALLRRVANLVELQLGGKLDLDFSALKAKATTIRGHSGLVWQDWTRHSSRQQQHMVLGGAMGRWTLHGELAPFWPLLHLGQWLHVGKNATFGLGRYHLEEPT